MTENKEGRLGKLSYDQFIGTQKTGIVKIEDLNKYNNSLIAYLDVLGIKSFIEQNRKGKEYIALEKIDEIRKIVKTSTDLFDKPDNFYHLHISDSFVFISDPKFIISLIDLLSTIQIRIINECQFLLRGAITIGDAIIKEDGKFIIGPAYIQAFQLQEKNAIYPRIIVDKSVVKEIKNSENPIEKYLKQDSDKEYFIDYIKVYMRNESVKRQEIKIRLRRENIYNHLKKKFKEFYEEENHNISQKYGWTIQYYKQIGVWEDE